MDRPEYIQKIKLALATHPVAALLGPRQCGKTTLARQFIDQKSAEHTVHFFDMEDPADLAALDHPMTALQSLEGLIVIDEVQRRPDLFPVIRVIVDQPKPNKQFLILGSASRDLIRQSSETLAGRIAYSELPPFSLFEVNDSDKLWIRGGYPRSFLSEDEVTSNYWRQQYIQTYLEQDIPNLGIRIAPVALRRFWMMLAHYHGQTFNASEIGRSMGIADTTVRHYLDVLAGTFMVRQLLPWLTNTKKRQVKRPKIYFRDSGILHSLQSIPNKESLLRHPMLGASWEGFAIEQIIRCHHVTPEECFYWGIHGQGELDLLLNINGQRIGFEFKYSDGPKLTSSMQMAVTELELDHLYVIYPGDKSYELASQIQVCPIDTYQARLKDRRL